MRLASIFQDHAVLQRDQRIPVWGVAAPNELVVVRFAGRTAQVTSNPDGRWLLRLPAVSAGGPHELTASAPSGSVTVRDVLVGEVWICSGQSNMEWKLAQTDQLGEPAANDLPGIRLITVRNAARPHRQDVVEGSWQVCSHRAIADFSAVGAWFGRELHRVLGVPVGLINNAWGGTRVQAWISRDGLVQDPSGLDDVRHFEGYVYDGERRDPNEYSSFADWEARGAPKDAGNAGVAKGWHQARFDDSAWQRMVMPSRWQDHGHPGSGVFWFRRSVVVPAGWQGRELELHIGAVDKHDDTYVNGERVGGLSWEAGANAWCTPRVFKVPAKLVGADGVVSVAVRARSHVFHGGLIGPSTEMRLHPAGDDSGALPLEGAWRYEIEQDWGVQTPPTMQWGDGNPNAPYTLFDSRIAPLLPYGIRGAIWYQGESNAHEALVYRRQMRLMIQDWRRAWGQGDFAFLQVQLANFRPVNDKPGRSDWAELREAQAMALAEPNTGFAVAIDVGDANDIHPRDKRSVGLRLARWALVETYHQPGVPSGPLFSGMEIESGARLRCRFQHGAGLKTRDGKAPSQVAIAGVDRQFVWAQTAIEGDTLVAWHPAVIRPAAVRYAWADNPDGCNLMNADGLPAAPFRSDSW